MSHDANPYEPSRLDAKSLTSTPGRRWVLIAPLAVGFFSGTAGHWIMFWTDELAQEFPPMGGALLAFIVTLCATFPALMKPKSLVLVGFTLGNANAFMCRPPHILNLFNDIPRQFAFAWFTAAIAFAICVAIAYAGFQLIRRKLDSTVVGARGVET